MKNKKGGIADIMHPKAVRKILRDPQRKHKRQPCEVCKKHQHLTHYHHLVSVKHQIEMIFEHNPPLEFLAKLEIYFVWLCPTCHAAWHKWQSRNTKQEDSMEMIMDFSEDERNRFSEIGKKESKAYSRFFEQLKEYI